MNFSEKNHDEILSELTKSLMLYRDRLKASVVNKGSVDKDTVIDDLMSEMQQYSLLLMKTQGSLNHKEKEAMFLRMELED